LQTAFSLFLPAPALFQLKASSLLPSPPCPPNIWQAASSIYSNKLTSFYQRQSTLESFPLTVFAASQAGPSHYEPSLLCTIPAIRAPSVSW